MKLICKSFAWALVLFLPHCPALAQTVTGAIRGIVTDSSGAIVARASVTASNVATGVPTATKTNPAGEYSIRFLPVGTYRLIVEASGFKTATYGPFALEIDQTAKIDIPLSVGTAASTVTVSAAVEPILDTESAILGETLAENTINSVALNGRDFFHLTPHTPGDASTGFNQYGSMN